MSWTTIIWFIFIFCIIVVSHEFGHYIIARMNGIHVVEFTIGVGPKIVGFHKNGTYYVIRWIPFGGACIFDGMLDEDVIENVNKGTKSLSEKANMNVDSEDEDADSTIDKTVENENDKDDEDIALLNAADAMESLENAHNYGLKFNDAPVWGRIATVVAGPLFNFILAYILSIFIVWFCGSYDPMIHDLMPDYPAAEAGLQDGDIITKINKANVKLADEISILVYLNRDGKPMDVTYKRDGVTHTTTIIPKWSDEDQRYYLGLVNYGEFVGCKNVKVFKYAAYEVRYCLVATVRSLGMLFSGKGSMDDLAGPVGMVQLVGGVEQTAKQFGFFNLFLNMINLAMFLSVNLGIMNLLPIPAIDGGRLLFLLIEAVRGKPVPPEKEGIVHFIGIILLLILMIVVLFNDIGRLISP